MVSSIDDLVEFYHWALAQGDRRVKNWPLMQFELMVVVFSLYLIILRAIIVFMRDREPFQLRTFAIVHNVNQVIISTYMFVEIVRQCLLNGYSIWGNGIDVSSSGDGMAAVIWLFYVSKVPEFLDTFIMALKKNNRQITFLHVYHHASIFVLWWIITYYTPGGDAYFSAMLNSFIHILMYSYYLWSTFSRKLRDGEKPGFTHPALYRKFITVMQLTQFALMFSQASYGLIFPPPIPFANFFAWMLFLYMLTMLSLFGNFFIQQYTKPPQKKSKSDNQTNGHANGHANGHSNGVQSKKAD